MSGKKYVHVRCLRDFSVALPRRDLHAKKGDVVTVELRVAKLMQRYELAEIITGVQKEMEL